MKVSLLKILRRKEQSGQDARNNYRPVVFSVCLIISFALWVMNMLSKKYTESVVFYIQYEHLPAASGHINATDTMRIKINTSGYRIVGYKLGLLDKFVRLDASQFRHKGNIYYYNIGNHTHTEKIEEQLGEAVKMLDISPDTLFILPAGPPTTPKT